MQAISVVSFPKMALGMNQSASCLDDSEMRHAHAHAHARAHHEPSGVKEMEQRYDVLALEKSNRKQLA